MALEWKSSEDRLNDELRIEIRVLAVELKHTDMSKIPQFWLHGSKVAAIDADLDEKIALAKGSNSFYRSTSNFKHFPTLERAKVYPGSLRQVLQEARKGIKSRGASPIRCPAPTKLIRHLVESRRRRTPGCDREQLLESLERLADELRRNLQCRSRGTKGDTGLQPVIAGGRSL